MGESIHSFGNDVLGKLDAVGIAAAIKRKDFSIAEATEAAIKRLELVNPALNAIVLKTYDDARKNLPIKYTDSLLYGVSGFVKDNDHLKGYPTQIGTGSFKAKAAKRNSAFVNQFQSVGIIVLGKTTMPEFGLICSTENPRWGITRNPWNTQYTTGGSSSGSAALVASGAVPIATANDGAGSIRIPAACCGLVGLKPSRHRLVHAEGAGLMPLQIVYEGVLTRSVRDTAAFYAEAEKFYLAKKLPKMGYVQHAGKRRLRIAFFENLPVGQTGHIDATTYSTLQTTAVLLEQLGHRVDLLKVPVNIDEMTQHYLRYYGFLSYMATHWSRLVIGAKVDKNVLEPFTLGLAQRFKEAPGKLPGTIKKLKQVGHKTELLFANYDVLLTPVITHTPPPIGYFNVELSSDEITRRAVAFATYCGLQNITGSPAISLPMGRAENNLPVAVQLAAPYGHEQRLLELAYELEEANPWPLLS